MKTAGIDLFPPTETAVVDVGYNGYLPALEKLRQHGIVAYVVEVRKGGYRLRLSRAVAPDFLGGNVGGGL